MSASAKDLLDRLRFCLDGRDLTARQEACIGALALLGIDLIARSPQDMQERARVLLALMGD